MESIDKVLGFLNDNHPFYIATMYGDTPRVRPFGFAGNHDGKLIFACNDQMNIFKQLKANPKFEISTTSKDNQWIRLNGEAKFIDSRETKETIVGLNPNLKNLSKDIDGIVIFFADKSEATFYSFTGAPLTVKL
jgi:uncharacterized pyridoxamine 5'-phosphate oxidase family protein